MGLTGIEIKQAWVSHFLHPLHSSKQLEKKDQINDSLIDTKRAIINALEKGRMIELLEIAENVRFSVIHISSTTDMQEDFLNDLDRDWFIELKRNWDIDVQLGYIYDERKEIEIGIEHIEELIMLMSKLLIDIDKTINSDLWEQTRTVSLKYSSEKLFEYFDKVVRYLRSEEDLLNEFSLSIIKKIEWRIDEFTRYRNAQIVSL